MATDPGPTSRPDFDRGAYRDRNAIERLVGKLKQFRRVATRYEKLDIHYLAFVQIASMTVWLRTFGGTAQLGIFAKRRISPVSCTQGCALSQ